MKLYDGLDPVAAVVAALFNDGDEVTLTGIAQEHQLTRTATSGPSGSILLQAARTGVRVRIGERLYAQAGQALGPWRQADGALVPGRVTITGVVSLFGPIPEVLARSITGPPPGQQPGEPYAPPVRLRASAVTLLQHREHPPVAGNRTIMSVLIGDVRVRHAAAGPWAHVQLIGPEDGATITGLCGPHAYRTCGHRLITGAAAGIVAEIRQHAGIRRLVIHDLIDQGDTPPGVVARVPYRT